jgi:CRP/FNR family transcriptional regulator, dissimilatory nitrate respiration regulator
MSVRSRLPARIQAFGIERTLKPNQVLFRMKGTAEGLFEVMSGKLRLLRRDAVAGEETMSIAVAGDLVGQGSLGSDIYHCDAVALTKTKVRLYRKAAVLAEVERDPDLARQLITMLAAEVMSLRTCLQLRAIRNARERVRSYLKLSADAETRTVTLPGTVKDLASYLGLTHEALYRTLSAMVSDGEIKRTKSGIVVQAFAAGQRD